MIIIKQYSIKLLATVLLMLVFILFVACKKDWLEAKPLQSQLIPNNIRDLQTTLDNTEYFNTGNVGLNETGTNDFYIAESYFPVRSEKDRNIYSWSSILPASFYANSVVGDWDGTYKSLFVANTVLENIENVVRDNNNKTDWDNIKGSALFYRAWLFYNLAQAFCKPYIPSSASMDLGLILRLSPDVSLPSQRATVQQSYDQIISDLLASLPLLPITPFNGWKTRPTKPASLALLARTYLAMQDYNKAKEYADQCLAISRTLMDYNNDASIDTAAQYPFSRYNPEVIFHCLMPTNSMTPQVSGNGYVDSVLYSLYSDPDLRKTLFFKPISGRLTFRGGYEGSSLSSGSTLPIFNGLATDEIYLIKAECQARKLDINGAMLTLDTLYKKRWNKAVPYQAFSATNEEDALRKIFLERRKELCFRCIRWTDLRRINQDPRFAVTLTRGLLGSSTVFTLPPNDNRYVYPIPQTEILYSGVPQNPR